jgi:hypothetical protein
VNITREQARDFEEAHGQGLHEDLPREGCPVCDGRELSSYPLTIVPRTARITHVRWTTPEGIALIRSSIGAGATQEVLDKVLREDREAVRQQYGDDVAATVKMDKPRFL